jgi:UDP-N-acetylmuramate dehydrogenase
MEVFADRLQRNVSLERYTAARVGGPAEAFLSVNSSEEMVEAVSRLWELRVPFRVLGGGSNILVSDTGVRGVVVYNRARQVRFDDQAQPPRVWAESGANFGVVARQAAARGLAGLEWAAGIPGTVGGAVVGNAGAHAGDTAGNLILAEILHLDVLDAPLSLNCVKSGIQIRREQWPVDRMEYGYRTSLIKRRSDAGQEAILPDGQPLAVVLAALLRLERSTLTVVQAKIDEYVGYRRRTQPPGASMGSMFKNPPGDYAGRLIEAAGLKRTRIGNAEISDLHGNFFINRGAASAADIWKLIRLARQEVAEKFGVLLELEIELVGDWDVEGQG